MTYKAKEGEPQDDTEEQDCSNNRKGNSGFLTKNFCLVRTGWHYKTFIKTVLYHLLLQLITIQ